MTETADGRPRRRSETSRQAILDAAYALVLERGVPALTIEGIAARAQVGKQTIYRWWPSKVAVAVEAFRSAALPTIVFPDTGDFTADLSELLSKVAALLSNPAFGPHAAGFLTETTRDPASATAFHDGVFAPIRQVYLKRIEAARSTGAIRADLSDDDLLDAAFGPIWFRLLTRPDALNPDFGRQIAHTVLNGALRSRDA